MNCDFFINISAVILLPLATGFCVMVSYILWTEAKYWYLTRRVEMKKKYLKAKAKKIKMENKLKQHAQNDKNGTRTTDRKP